MRLVVIGLVLASATATAEPKPKPPCTGCVLETPRARDAPVPLLVVLHGDRAHAPGWRAHAPGWRAHAIDAVVRWRAAARAKGWAVLALECPKDRGCKDSWWQWNGDPAYVHDQIDKVAATLSIDRTRVVLAGWSGGGTYIGLRAQAWAERFAGVVIHGGGMPPIESVCPAKPLPAYFLVGDRNPLHRLAGELRAFFGRCEQPIVWDLVRGGEHDREDRALDAKKAGKILDWLAERPRS